MDFNKLYSLICEDVFDLQHDDGTFESAMKLFYELEYKLNIAKYNMFVGLEKRRENIVAKLEDELSEMIDRMKLVFINVFNSWLRAHQISNPDVWAEIRVDENYYFDEDAKVSFLSLVKDYSMLEYCNKSSANFDKFPNELKTKLSENATRYYITIVSKNLENYKEFCDTLIDKRGDVLGDLKEELYSQYSHEDKEIQSLGAFYFNEPKTFQEAAEFFKNMNNDKFFIQEMIKWFLNDDEMFKMLITDEDYIRLGKEFARKNLYYEYVKYWNDPKKQQDGITLEKTRKRLIKALKFLSDSDNLNDKISAMSIALNASHQSKASKKGSMLEYVAKYLVGIGDMAEKSLQETFDDMTNGTMIDKWNDDMAEAGFSLERK